jgi:hypothetical protein
VGQGAIMPTQSGYGFYIDPDTGETVIRDVNAGKEVFRGQVDKGDNKGVSGAPAPPPPDGFSEAPDGVKVAQAAPPPPEGFSEAPSVPGVAMADTSEVRTFPKIDYGAPIEAARAAIDKLPAGARELALEQWAQQVVGKEREKQSYADKMEETARNIMRGTPVGSWLDRAVAGTAAGAYGLTGGAIGAPYDETLAYEREKNRQSDEASPTVFTLPSKQVPGIGYVGGPVTRAGLEKFLGGAITARLAPQATPFQGQALLPTMGNLGTTGALYGGLYGLGETPDLTNPYQAAKDTLSGATVGGVLGGGLPIPAIAGANAAGRIWNRFRPLPTELQPFDRPAVDIMARTIRNEAMMPAQIGDRFAELGRQGMVADLGPNTRAITSALANQPGEHMSTVVNPLNARHAGAEGRIEGTLNAAMGAPVNENELLHGLEQRGNMLAAPLRTQYERSSVPFTQRLESLLGHIRQNEPGVLTTAHRLFNHAQRYQGATRPQFFARQVNGQWHIDRVPNAREWDFIKRALDENGRMTAAQWNQASGQERTTASMHRQMARELRTEVQRVTSPTGRPQDSVYAQLLRYHANAADMRDAYEMGYDAMKRGVTADQMNSEINGVGVNHRGALNNMEREAYRTGARNYIRDQMDFSSTGLGGANPATKAQALLSSRGATRKLETVSQSPAHGQAAANRINAEIEMAQTRQQAVGNSATAVRLQAQRELPNPNARNGHVPIISPEQVVAMLGQKMVDALVDGAITEAQERTLRDVARMMVRQGADGNRLAQALNQFADRANVTAARRARIQRIAAFVRTVAPGIRSAEIDRNALRNDKNARASRQRSAQRFSSATH